MSLKNHQNIKVRQYQYLIDLIRSASEPLTSLMIQKIMFIDQIKRNEQIYQFNRHYFGPYSNELANDIITLKRTHVLLSEPEKVYDDDILVMPIKYSYNDKSNNKVIYQSAISNLMFPHLKYDLNNVLSEIHNLVVHNTKLGDKIDFLSNKEFSDKTNMLLNNWEINLPSASKKIDYWFRNEGAYSLSLLFFLGLFITILFYIYNL